MLRQLAAVFALFVPVSAAAGLAANAQPEFSAVAPEQNPLQLQVYFSAGLQEAFVYLAPQYRRQIQNELAIAGLYNGGIDGEYGPGTEQALIEGAAYIEWSSSGRLYYDLNSPRGIVNYFQDLLTGEAAAWLYGEGEECDSC